MILNTKQYLGPCACGRDHELRTKLVVCEYGALERFVTERRLRQLVYPITEDNQ